MINLVLIACDELVHLPISFVKFLKVKDPKFISRENITITINITFFLRSNQQNICYLKKLSNVIFGWIIKLCLIALVQVLKMTTCLVSLPLYFVT